MAANYRFNPAKMNRKGEDYDVWCTNVQKNNHLTGNQTVAKLNLYGIAISKSSYAKIETNRMNIKVSELVALKMIFKTEYANFFLGLEESFQ